MQIGDAEERAALRSTPPTPQPRFRSSAKSSKLHRSKSCVVGCEVIREKLGSGAKPATPNNVRHSAPRLQHRYRRSAKSIAACRMYLQKNQLKNLHGGLRYGHAGLASESLLKVRLRCNARHALRGYATSAKSIAPCRMHL